MKKKLFILLFTISALGACGGSGNNSSDSDVSNAYEQGLKEGKNKGFEEGKVEGYQEGYDEGYEEGYDETKRPKVEVKHGYREHTYPVKCPKCLGEGFIIEYGKQEICPTCKMSGVVQVREKEYY